MLKIKLFYYQYAIEIYQSLLVLFFITIISLLCILEFKSGAMESYKHTLVLLKTRSDQQIREIVILQEQYKYQTQEITQLKARVAYADTAMRKDIEDLKTKTNSPPIKHLKR
jgi:hypothetical protein